MGKSLKAVDTPVGDIEYAFITGEGKPDLQGVPKYSVNIVLDAETGAAFKEKVLAYWEDNKPKGSKAPKSIGIYEHKVLNREKTEEQGEKVYDVTGNVVVTLKTGISYQSGDAKVIKIFNSKGNEVSLQGKKIGNGSRGRAQGAMDIYTKGGAPGVTFYLNGLQLSKFVEYSGGGSFGEIEGGDFDGVEGGMGALAEESSSETERPRL